MGMTMTRRGVCATGLAALALASAAGAQSAPQIAGEVLWRERMALPEGAVLAVNVEDVSRADAPATTVAATLLAAGPGSPVPFRLDLPELVPRNAYSLRARVIVDGRVWFISTDHIPVTGPAEGLTVPVQRIGGARIVPVLPGQWVATDTPKGVQANLTFAPDGMVFGTGGCNRLTGRYHAKGEALTFGAIASTNMACLPEAMAYETAFHAALAATQGLAFAEGGTVLHLTGADGAVLLRLTRPPA